MSEAGELYQQPPGEKPGQSSGTDQVELAPVIPLAENRPEKPAFNYPETELEEYLLSDVGRKELMEIYAAVDAAPNIVRTLDHEITEAIHTARHTIYAKLLAGREDDRLADGSDALMRHELVELYDQNAVINECLRRFQANKAKGDRDASKVYLATAKIFMHFVRFEWLQGIHDPESEAWLHRGENLGLFTGTVMEANIPSIPGRPNIVMRKSTPSDRLPFTNKNT